MYRHYLILLRPWDRAQTVTKSNMLQNQIRLHHQNMTLGIGKTVTESNMSQNQKVTKSNNACTLFFPCRAETKEVFVAAAPDDRRPVGRGDQGAPHPPQSQDGAPSM